MVPVEAVGRPRRAGRGRGRLDAGCRRGRDRRRGAGLAHRHLEVALLDDDLFEVALLDQGEDVLDAVGRLDAEGRPGLLREVGRDLRAEHVALGADVVPLEVRARRLGEQGVAQQVLLGARQLADLLAVVLEGLVHEVGRAHVDGLLVAEHALTTSRDTGPGAAPYLPRR